MSKSGRPPGDRMLLPTPAASEPWGRLVSRVSLVQGLGLSNPSHSQAPMGLDPEQLSGVLALLLATRQLQTSLTCLVSAFHQQDWSTLCMPLISQSLKLKAIQVERVWESLGAEVVVSPISLGPGGTHLILGGWYVFSANSYLVAVIGLGLGTLTKGHTQLCS